MKRSLLYFLIVLAGVATRAQDADEPATTPEPDPTNGRIPIRYQSSHGRDRVAVGHSVRVEEGEVVHDVVVVGGSAIVNGKVTGDFVVVAGKAQLGPKAEISRDVTVVAGALDAHPDAKIKGDRVVVGFDTNFPVPASFEWMRQWVTDGLFLGRPLPHQHGWAWVLAGIFLVLYLLMALLFPGPIRAGVNVLQTRPGSSLLTGLLAFLLIGPLVILLLITVIGSILVPFLMCGAIAAFFFGKVVVYGYAGGQILGGRSEKPLLPVLIGAVLFTILYAIPVLGFLVWGVAAPLGVGAVLLAFSGRVRREKPNPPPSLPPSMVPPPTAYPPEPGGVAPAGASLTTALPRAGFWLRFVGTLIDLILIGAMCTMFRLKPPAFIVIWTAYHILLWGLKGATIGGMVVGSRIIRTDGGPIGFSVAVVRALAAFLSAAGLMLGFFWAGWSSQKQSWHDIIAGTFVVRTGRSMHPTPVPAPVNQ